MIWAQRPGLKAPQLLQYSQCKGALLFGKALLSKRCPSHTTSLCRAYPTPTDFCDRASAAHDGNRSRCSLQRCKASASGAAGRDQPKQPASSREPGVVSAALSRAASGYARLFTAVQSSALGNSKYLPMVCLYVPLRLRYTTLLGSWCIQCIPSKSQYSQANCACCADFSA